MKVILYNKFPHIVLKSCVKRIWIIFVFIS